MVNIATAFPKCETPNTAATENPAQQSSGQAQGSRISDFSKQLEAVNQKIKLRDKLKVSEKGGNNKEEDIDDNGMTDDPGTKPVLYGIVGILEGLGLLSYQSGGNEANTAAQPEGALQSAAVQQLPEAVNTEDTKPAGLGAAEALIQALAGKLQNIAANAQPVSENANQPQQAEKAQAATVLAALVQRFSQRESLQEQGKPAERLPEQIAGMLESIQGGAGNAPTQDEILEAVGKYLDSLENTNKTGVDSRPANAPAEGVSVAAPENTSADKTEKAFGLLTTDKTLTLEKAQAAKSEVAQENPPQSGGQQVKGAAVHTEASVKPEAENAPVNENRTEGVKPEEKLSVKTEMPSGDGKAADVKTGGAPAVTHSVQTERGTEAKPVTNDAKADTQTIRENVMRIVDKVSAQAAEGKHDIQVDLKPDYLGKVSIRMSMKDGSIRMQIRTDDVAVKGMFSSQTSSLQDMLRDKGIHVATIDVTYDGQSMLQSDAQAFSRQGENSRGGQPYYASYADAGSTEQAAERYDFYLGGSSVEYLA